MFAMRPSSEERVAATSQVRPEKAVWQPRLRPFALILATAFTLQLFATLYLHNLYYPDEIYQTLEAGHRLAFGNGIVTWEWREGIRSYVFPFLLSVLMRATVWMGHGSAGYLTAVAVVMSLLFLGVAWFCYVWAGRSAGNTAALIAGGTAAVWFFLVFMGSKTFSEVISADVFLPALLLGTGDGGHSRKKRLLGSGLLCGVAVSLRPQLLPAVLFAAVWMCWSDARERVPSFAAGFAASALAFGLVDAATLGYPFASVVRYFWVNVAQGRSKLYGTEPPYFYALQLLHLCWPLLPGAVLGVRRSPFLAWLVLVLVGSHSVLAHKEFRFVYLAIPLVITLFGIGCAEFGAWLRKRSPARHVAWPLFPAAVLTLVCMFSLLLGARFKRWHVQSGLVQLSDRISRTPQACAVAFYPYDWPYSPGYTHVHSRIPMFFYTSAAELQADESGFNELLLPSDRTGAPSGFRRVQCVRDACLYERPGTCTRAQHPEVNAELIANHR